MSPYTETIPPDVKYVRDPSFNLPRAEERFWGADSPEIRIPTFLLSAPVEPDEPLGRRRPFQLTRDQERALFLRYNYAKFRLCQARRAGHYSEAHTWDDRQNRTKAQLLEANLPLVPAMAKRRPVSDVEFSELISEGYMAVLRCVECFDVSRGYKFSTYACRAILSAFRRRAGKQRTYRRYVPVSYDPDLDGYDQTAPRQEERLAAAVDLIRDIMDQNRAGLTPTEKTVLTRRFPMTPDRKPWTLKRIGDELGLSSERVRQVERACLAKLRTTFQDCQV